ncbi:MAG: hypothetical protein M1829_004744 [Trizodia sp. TS-e1964]|nr:MAG: hypothetical protein M1829_004744 [Trizodia sp. TS-e1964]
MPSSELPGADFHASPLPDSSSPTLALVRATPAEVRKTWEANGPFWRGPLSLAQFFQREQHLLSQSLTRNGGMTHWILVDNAQASQGQDRRILCACETIRKKALVAYADGRVEDVISHGIGSVFCDPRFRRRGYAARMMKELAAILRGWQSNQGNCLFTELYSDIGKVGRNALFHHDK